MGGTTSMKRLAIRAGPPLLAWALASALVLGVACAGDPRPIEYEAKPATADGLYRVRAYRVSAAFVRPGADFSHYTGLVIDPVTVATTAPLGDASIDRLKKIFQEAFERQLGRSKVFEVVSEAGPDVLRVAGHIVDLSVDVPAYSGGDMNFIVSAGEMTLILDVRDSRTGTPLARMADRRKIAPSSAGLTGGYESNAVNNWGAVREICNDWARLLRGGLDDLHQIPIPPAPPEPASD
jgi:hypothetical protein